MRIIFQILGIENVGTRLSLIRAHVRGTSYVTFFVTDDDDVSRRLL